MVSAYRVSSYFYQMVVLKTKCDFYENYIETSNKEQGTDTHTSLQTMRSDIANREIRSGDWFCWTEFRSFVAHDKLWLSLSDTSIVLTWGLDQRQDNLAWSQQDRLDSGL